MPSRDEVKSHPPLLLSERLRDNLADDRRRPLAVRVIDTLTMFKAQAMDGYDLAPGLVLMARVSEIAHSHPAVQRALTQSDCRQLVCHLFTYIHRHVNQLSAKEAFSVLLGMERVGGVYNRTFIQDLASLVKAGANSLNHRQLLSAVRAFNALGGSNSEFYAVMYKQLLPEIVHFSREDVHSISRIFLSYGQAGYVEHGLAMAAARASTLSNCELTLCAASLGECPSSTWYRGGFEQEVLARLLRTTEPQKELVIAAANMAIALARQGIQNHEFLEIFGERAATRTSWLSIRQLAWLPWAYSRGRYLHEGFLNAIATESRLMVAELSGAQLRVLSNSFRRFGVPHDQLLSVVSQRFKGDFSSLNTDVLTELLYSFALLSEPCGPRNVQAIINQMRGRTLDNECRIRMHVAAVAAGVEQVPECPSGLEGCARSRRHNSLPEVVEQVSTALTKVPGVIKLKNAAPVGIFIPDLHVKFRDRSLAISIVMPETFATKGGMVSPKHGVHSRYVGRYGYELIGLPLHEVRQALGREQLTHYLAEKIGVSAS